MSLRDKGGEEECFEWDCRDEERRPTLEQHDTLDLAEEGKFCTLHKSDPFHVSVVRAVLLRSQLGYFLIEL